MALNLRAYIYIYISQWTVATLKDPIQSSPTTSNYCYLHRMENYNHNNNQQWLEIRFEPQVRLFLTVTFPFRFVISPFFFSFFFSFLFFPFTCDHYMFIRDCNELEFSYEEYYAPAYGALILFQYITFYWQSSYVHTKL